MGSVSHFMKTWTKDQVAALREFHARGIPIGDQAEALGKTTESITSKRYKLGLGRNPPEIPIGKIEYAAPVPTEASEVLHPDILWRAIRGVQKTTVLDLADKFNKAPKEIVSAATKLFEQGRALTLKDGVILIGDQPSGGTTEHRLVLDPYVNGARKIRFGVVSDQHLCSNYERLDVLNALYDVFEEEGIENVYSPGNFIDGEARFNKNDIHVHGMDRQFRYFAKTYPKREGIKTYLIGGDDHEGWYVQREGIDIGRTLTSHLQTEGRGDIEYLGYMEHDVVIPAPNGQTRIRLLHPGGGTAYALSYQPQKLIESLTGGEKPDVLLIGHYHKAEYLHYRNIHAIQAGCTVDQTPFMRKKRLSAHVGGWMVEMYQADDGSIRRFTPTWMNFFDKGYHEREWSYKLGSPDA